MKSLSKLCALSITGLAVGFLGCAGESSSDGPETAGPPATADSHEGHNHPSEGPHHGDLVELGNEEYHAEVLHDDAAGTVTIYVLNSGATEQVPIEATEIMINVKHDGKPEQFELAATPDENDPAGKSSRFVSKDKELAEHLDEEDAAPQLVLSINGKSFRGKIAHDHDHAHGDHDHDKH